MKTWFEKTDDGRSVAFASLGGFRHWVIEGTELRALRGLRQTLRIHGRDDLIPQLGLAD